MSDYYSINRFAGDGTTTIREFNFSGGYLDKGHVKAYLERASGIREPITVTTGMFIGDFTLDLGIVAEVGETHGIYRDTPKDAPLANFVEGARLTERNLDLLATQAVFVAAEAYDAFTESVGYSTLALEQAELALTTATSALAVANSSVSASTTALTLAEQAQLASSAAEAAAANAVATANNAAALAVTASTNAAAALALATTADANASSALLIASDIAGTANDALEIATAAQTLAFTLQADVAELALLANDAVNTAAATLEALNSVMDKVSDALPYNITAPADFGDLSLATGDFSNEIVSATTELTMSKGSLTIDYD